MKELSKENKLLMAVFAVLGIICLSIAAAYAWFNYAKTGTKMNSISSGTITFHYEEKSQGLTLNDAVPLTDGQGKSQNKYFEFDVTSRTSSTVSIPYDITVRRSGTGTNMDGIVKVYLTKVNGGVEAPVELLSGKVVVTVSELTQYINSSLNIDATKNERKLLTEEVPTNSNNYTETYRLRMWISDEAEYLIQETKYYCDGTVVEYNSAAYTACDPSDLTSQIVDSYPYQNQTYTLKVNVYGEAEAQTRKVVTYNANGGTGTMADSYDVVAANTFTAPEGKVFKSWNTQADGLGTTYAVASAVSTNLTLYAIWDSYTLACPGEGCKYLYKAIGNSYHASDILAYGPNARDLTQAEMGLLKDNYQEVGKDYFLGVKLNGNKIEHAYACGIRNNTLFCIEGALNDASGGNEETRTAIFNANKTLVQSPSLWNNGCDPGTTYVMCNTALSALINTDGNVAVGTDDSSCHVENDGEAICYE